MKIFLFVALLLFAIVSAVAVTSNNNQLDAIYTSQNFTGVARAWTGFNQLAYGKQFGYLNPRFSSAMPPDATFPVASNTKVFVALGLYQLQEAGKVVLADSIANYLDNSDFVAFGFPGIHSYCPLVAGNSTCQTVTFVQLLDMTAGLADTNFQFLPYPGTIAGVVGRYISSPLLFIPGTKFYYSNPAFMLASYFIEKFSGQTFARYIQDHIVTRAGMKHTYFDPYNGKFGLDEKRVDEFYQFYDQKTKRLLRTGMCSSEFDLGSAAGAGGIVSNVEDEMMLYYKLFNFSEGAYGKPFLNNPKSLDELVRPRTFISTGSYFAQGLFVQAPSNVVMRPDQIVYEGEIMCSHTSNYFDLTQKPVPVMTQSWSNVMVFYTTEEEIASVMEQDNQNFWTVLGTMQKRTSLQELSQQLLNAIVSK